MGKVVTEYSWVALSLSGVQLGNIVTEYSWETLVLNDSLLVESGMIE